MTSSSESRQFRRVPIAYEVKLVTEDRMIVYASAVNLSMSGILLGGRPRLPVGSQCGVAILLAEPEVGKRIVARGTVVRADEDGMAIEFAKALDKDSVKALQLLIESVDPAAVTPLSADGPAPEAV